MDDYLKNYAVKELVEELNLSNIKQIKGKVMWDCDLMWEKKDDGWYIQVKPAFGNPPHVDIQWVFIALVKIYFIENNLTNNLAKDVSDLYRQVSFEEQDFKVIETGVYEIVASLDFLKCLLYLNKINKLHRPNLDEMCKLALTIPFREYLEYVFMQAMKRHMGGDITEFLNRFENLFDDKKRSEEFMNFLGALLYRGEYNYKDVIIILNHFFPDLKNLDLSKRLLSEITDLNEAIEVEKERQINLNLLTEFRKFEKKLDSIKEDTSQISEVNNSILILQNQLGSLSFIIDDFNEQQSERILKILTEIDSMSDTLFNLEWNNDLMSGEINELLNRPAFAGLSEEDKSKVDYKINKSEIAIKHKLKLTIPIIGKYLKYEGELELSNKQKMPENLEELKKLFFKD